MEGTMIRTNSQANKHSTRSPLLSSLSGSDGSLINKDISWGSYL